MTGYRAGSDIVRYDLPMRLESLGIEGDRRVMDEDSINRFLDSLEEHDYDVLEKDSRIFVGDGKNVYGIKVDNTARRRILPDEYVEVQADCVGVCAPEKYRAIVENEEDGFNSVHEFLDGEFSSAAWYDPDQKESKENDSDTGFIYHGGEPEDEDESDGLPNSNAAQSTVDAVESE